MRLYYIAGPDSAGWDGVVEVTDELCDGAVRAYWHKDWPIRSYRLDHQLSIALSDVRHNTSQRFWRECVPPEWEINAVHDEGL